ncbi:hypothetical protein SMTE5_31090 [Serratia marcescens]|jgi:hypothetical protein|uniref:phage tail fiber protein n=1 Tax=Serratia TaxID=613 RepID=UPI00146C8D51|nr:phage tail protein [Serratia marcescens]MBH2769244.1 phage tail protein [Serratia marcescens]MBI6125270.1 phage tail protein [Serratia marcescens]NMT27017.1 phage tail protein [Serratia marcescens]BEM54482.1 hypothetical protein SME20J_31690 [Serratia marcescens]BEO82078.1 hypothetical protein SMTE5_31090 [Serratia marcescens]
MWYKTGKINVVANSASVSATGTQWGDAKYGVMPGMMLLAPDNKLYEIKSVNSNASLTLNSNYSGETANGQPYAIITTYEGDISQFSARFSALLTYFQGSRSELIDVLTGTGDVKLTKEDGSLITVPSYSKLMADMQDKALVSIDRLRFAMPATTTADVTYLWGTLVNFPQNGATVSIDIVGGAGFNGQVYNNTGAQVIIRTGTQNNVVNSRGRISARVVHSGNEVIIKGLSLVETSANNYDVYVTLGSFMASNYYTVQGGSLSTMLSRWVNKGTRFEGDLPASNMNVGIYAQYVESLANKKIDLQKCIWAGDGTGIGGTSVHKDDAFEMLNRFYRINQDSANYPGGAGNVAVVSLPLDGSPSAAYLAVSGQRHAWVGQGSNYGENKGKIFWQRVFTDLYAPAVSELRNGKDYGLTGAVTAAARLNLDSLYQSSPLMVINDAINRPAELGVGAAFIKVESWKVDGGAEPGSLRTRQVVSGYGSLGSESGKVFTRVWNGTKWTGWIKDWTEATTTVDGNGFIKKASPIARLSSDPQRMNSDFLAGFMLAGVAAINPEAAGVTAEKLTTGVYRLTGARGFAKEGWTFEIPQDGNGNRLCFVETETDDDGVVTVRVSKRRFDADTAMVIAGEPMDIPAGRWIDLRLDVLQNQEVDEKEKHAADFRDIDLADADDANVGALQ